MKELLKKLGFEHLPMLSEFVKAVNKLETLTKFFQINRYTDFITQPLTKENTEPFEIIGGRFPLDHYMTFEEAINDGAKFIFKQ